MTDIKTDDTAPQRSVHFVVSQGDMVHCFGSDADAFLADLAVRLNRGDKMIGSKVVNNGLYVNFEVCHHAVAS